MAHPGGRPTSYRPEYCQMLIDHMEEGLSFESFAGVIGVNRDTIFEWAKVQTEFSDAKKAGFEKSRLTWERIGLNISKLNEGNPTAFIFNMKNRFPDDWKDKKEVDNTHDFKNRPDWLDAAK
jgi:hypothetical protein